MSKGAPSSRLLERARRLKQTVDTLKNKVISEKSDGRAKRRCRRRFDCVVVALLNPCLKPALKRARGVLGTVLAVISHGPSHSSKVGGCPGGGRGKSQRSLLEVFVETEKGVQSRTPSAKKETAAAGRLLRNYG